MRLNICYDESGVTRQLEEPDDLVGPDSTILDIKGLIKMWTGEPVSRQGLLLGGKLLDDHETLEELGLSTQEAADAATLTLHLLDDEDMSDAIQEFSHEDFIKASMMQGKSVPVTMRTLHEEELRREEMAKRIRDGETKAPRMRPSGVKTTVTTDGHQKSDVYKIFEECKYGLRQEGVDKKLAVKYPGVTDDIDYWDLRLPESNEVRWEGKDGEMVLEIFYFGELSRIYDHEMLRRLVKEKLASEGIEVRMLDHPLRDAGCMYPLIAMCISLSTQHAESLGRMVFEHFGKPRDASRPNGGQSGKNGGEGCVIQ